MTDRLRIVTRADLAHGSRAVQAVHAMREWVDQYPILDQEWYEKSNTIALLEVPNESKLRALLERATERGIPVASCSVLGVMLGGCAHPFPWLSSSMPR